METKTEPKTEPTKTTTPVDGANNQGLPTAADIPPPIQGQGTTPPVPDPLADPAKPVNTLGSAPGTDPLAPPANTLGTPPEPKSPEEPLETQVKAEGVPDVYKPFDKAPEGFAMDQATTKLFQDAKLSQEGAQVIIDGLRTRQAEDATLRQQQLMNTHLEDVTKLKQDEKFGGMLYEKTLKDAVLGMNRISQMMGNDNLWQVIESANLKSHPEVVKLFAMIEKWHGEKSFLTGENNSVDLFGDDPSAIIGKKIAAERKAYYQNRN